MVRKTSREAKPTAAAAAAGLFDTQLAQSIRDSAQQIWLAGLGAFARAQGEGNRFFENLIKEGTTLHRKTHAAAGERIGDVAGRMTQMAGEVGQKANSHWDKLESIFEQRTSRALGRLGVPTARDVAALAARVTALEAELARVQPGSRPAAGAKTARKTRAAAKKA